MHTDDTQDAYRTIWKDNHRPGAQRECGSDDNEREARFARPTDQRS